MKIEPLTELRLQLECEACAVRLDHFKSPQMDAYDCTGGPGCKFREHAERESTALRMTVFEALDTAVENDTDFSQFKDATAIAVDLGTHCAGLDGMEPDVLLPHVEAWLAQHNAEPDQPV